MKCNHSLGTKPSYRRIQHALRSLSVAGKVGSEDSYIVDTFRLFYLL